MTDEELDGGLEGGGPVTGKVCPEHGLRYDPSQTLGCVQCRQEEPVSVAKWQVAVVILIALIVVWQLATHDWNPIKLGGIPADWLAGDYADCRLSCAEKTEKCSAMCEGTPGLDLCGQVCLVEHSQCLVRCNGTYKKAAMKHMYSYSVGLMPQWLQVIQRAADEYREIEACTEDPARYWVRVSVDSDGKAKFVFLATSSNEESSADCAKEALERVQYPVIDGEPYVFVAKLGAGVKLVEVMVSAAKDAVTELTRVGADPDLVHFAKLELEHMRRMELQQKADRESEKRGVKKAGKSRRHRSSSSYRRSRPSRKSSANRPCVDCDEDAREKKWQVKAREKRRKRIAKDVRQRREERERGERLARERRERMKAKAECEDWRRRMIKKHDVDDDAVPPCWYLVSH